MFENYNIHNATMMLRMFSFVERTVKNLFNDAYLES